MKGAVDAALVAVTGVATAFLASTGAYAAYLKPSMRFPLLGAGVLMAVVGLWAVHQALVAPSAPGPDDGDDSHGGDGDGDEGHGVGDHRLPRVAWLLVLPLLAAVLLQPPALGADAARRESATAVRPAPSGFAPLPAPRDGAVDLRVGDFVARARFDGTESLAGVRVRLTGFVVRDPDLDDGYLLTRFAMACCAGDALPQSVEVRGLDGEPPADDTWVDVVGTWSPASGSADSAAGSGGAAPVRLDLEAQAVIEAPTFPYE